tara:strand:+ start:845 stop:2923 length:2079 start_codon:yes stop_codon:yes gene_type:complete
MAIIPRYEVEGGKFDPEQIVDLVPELDKSNKAIQASEERRLNQLIQNSEDRIKKTERMWDQLGTLSTTIQDIAQKRKEKHRADREAVISFDMLTKGISPELEEVFRGNRELLFQDSLKVEEFAAKIEADTGDSITANDFRKMAGWEQYMVAEQWILNEAKGYNEYFYKAYQTAEVDVLRDGVMTTINKDNPPQNAVEQAALDEKIKFDYARRFAGLNESLIATVLKKEIDKQDNLRRKEQAIAREKAYQKQVKESDLGAIENGFVTADPSDGYNNLHKVAEKYAARNQMPIQFGRTAVKGYLKTLVSENKITYPQAMSIINHEEQARDGSMKSLTSWKEWSDLPEVLAEAAVEGEKAKQEQKKAQITTDEQFIRTRDDWTNEEKSLLMDIYREKYDGYVPNELQSALAGHLEDDVATDMLEQAVRHQGGVYDFQLANVSNDVYDQFKGKLIDQGATTPGSPDSKKAQKYIKAATDEGSEETYGTAETASTRWLNLYYDLTDTFNDTYRRTYMDSKGNVTSTPEQAFQAALAAVQAHNKDDARRRASLRGDYTTEEFERGQAYMRNLGVALNQGGGKKWKKNRINLIQEEDLINWSQTPLKLSSDLPQFIKDVARGLTVSPIDLAQAQLRFLLDEEVKIDKKEEPDPDISRLIYYYPTASRITRARILNESKDIEQNVKTSIYNKKALIRSDL